MTSQETMKRFEALEQRMRQAEGLDARVEHLEARFEARFEALEQRMRQAEGLDARMEHLEALLNESLEGVEHLEKLLNDEPCLVPVVIAIPNADEETDDEETEEETEEETPVPGHVEPLAAATTNLTAVDISTIKKKPRPQASHTVPSAASIVGS